MAPDESGRRPEQDLLDELQRSREIPPGTTASDAITAVFCALTQRLEDEPAEQVLEPLPRELKESLHACVAHRAPRGAFHREAFVRAVASHLELSMDEADGVARRVLEVVKAELPKHTVREVERRLPADLRVLWTGEA